MSNWEKKIKKLSFEKNFFFRKSESSFRALYHRRRITLPLPSPPLPPHGVLVRPSQSDKILKEWERRCILATRTMTMKHS